MNKLGALVVAVAVPLVATLPPLDGVVSATTTSRYIVQFDEGTDPDVAAAAVAA